MRCSFAFSCFDSEYLLVVVELPASQPGVKAWFAMKTFPNENEFIRLVATFVHDPDVVNDLIAHVLLVTSDLIPTNSWTCADLPTQELREIGFSMNEGPYGQHQ